MSTPPILTDFVRAICTVNSETGWPEFVMGTGFEFVPGFVLTAGHVMEEILKIYDGLHYDQFGEKKMRTLADRRRVRDGTFVSSVRVACIGTHRTNKEDLLIQPVMSSGGYDRTELVVLRVGEPYFLGSKTAVQFDDAYTGIAFRFPEKDLEVLSFGYPGGAVTVENDRPLVHLEQVPAFGRVTGSQPDFREGSLGYPQATVAMKSAPGMSGAPVFEQLNGRLIGVVSRSLDQEEHSTVALLWPLAANDLFPGVSLRKLSAEGKFFGVDLENITGSEGVAGYRCSGPISKDPK